MTEERFREFIVMPGDDIQSVLDRCRVIDNKCRINFAPGIYYVPTTLNVFDNIRLEGYETDISSCTEITGQ